jgi:3-hydroxyacyl-CoA dehydrogenase
LTSTSTVQLRDIAVIHFFNPPVNALSVGEGVVAALRSSVQRALDDNAVSAVVLTAKGRLFSGGADIKDFDSDLALLDEVRTLAKLIEQSPKPVVMAINGPALGGGLEIALSGHYRLAAGSATFALPEVMLGLLPGGGGTQRLPRLIGADAALALITSGQPLTASDALKLGLVDRLTDENLVDEAVETARGLVGQPPRRTRDLRPAPLAEARADNPKDSDAVRAIIRCVDSALSLPFEEGLLLEKQLFEDLARSPASAGLRHVFFGKRRTGQIQGLDLQAGPSIDTVAIIGGGLMGTGIANAILNADLPVILVEPLDAVRERATATIAKALRRDADKGRIAMEEASRRLGLLTVTASIEDIASADLVIEAVFEDVAVKRTVLGNMDRLAKPSAILASNTSTLNLNELASFTTCPDRVVGLHFFSPATVMQLVEIVRGSATSAETLDASVRFTRALKKVPVISGVCDGFIGNRMFEEYLRQVYFLLEEGALPAGLDAALECWGMAMGPLKTMDLAGQDIGWKIRQRRKIEQPDRPYSGIPDLICEMGRFGQKTGSGFYRYEGRVAVQDPVIDQLIIDYSARHGIERREISDSEIVERCVFALINEGAKILDEGIAQTSADVDMVYVFGYGFPAHRGGPMFYADTIGRPNVLTALRAFARGRNGWAWDPADSLTEHAG